MKKWLIGGIVFGAGAVGAYFAFPTKHEVLPTDFVRGAPVVAVPPDLAIPAEVVDVTDIDALLDPPAIPAEEPESLGGPVLISVGYAEPVPTTSSPAGAPAPIPPADEEEPPPVDVAPMPREVGG